MLHHIFFSFLLFIYFLFPSNWSTAVTSRCRPGEIKDHKRSKHSESVYRMDPRKSSQGWLSQEVFYFKRFLFPWGRAQGFKWKPDFAGSLKGAWLQQSSCSLSCHQHRLVPQEAGGALLLHCSCTSLQLAPCTSAFTGPWGTVFSWKKSSKTTEKLFPSPLITKDYPLCFGLPSTSA